MDDGALAELAEELGSVRGVLAVALGGSRARGTHRPDSDIDLGLYYRGDLDVAALQALAEERSSEPVVMTAPGGWGPWVNGGGWLTVDGWRVDWIYRDLDRVRQVRDECQDGRYEVGFQVGHPLGFYSHAYAGEVALCRVLADTGGELTGLQEQTWVYPAALGDALVRGLWEADFAVRLAGYAAGGAAAGGGGTAGAAGAAGGGGAADGDPAYATGCLFRAVGVACHALHGRAGQWLINEKGMVASAGRLAIAPPQFAERAQSLLARVGQTRREIEETVDRAEALIAAVRAAVTA